MAKERYKIPSSLDASYLDLEFQLQTKDGVGPSTPITGKTILLILVSIILWFYIMFQTSIGKGGAIVVVGFTIMWICLSVLLVKPDKTKRHGFDLVLSMVNYLPKRFREIPVRLTDPVTNMQVISGTDYVDPEDGMIHFLDGTVGYLYQVVGSASILMFDNDRNDILSKVDTFYRKLPVGVEIIYDTVKEAQRTDAQVKSAIDGYRQLKTKSPGLQALYKERHQVLKYGVGERFKSTHQYAILKASNETSLMEGEDLIRGDAENAGLMFKRARVMGYTDVQKYMKEFFGT